MTNSDRQKLYDLLKDSDNSSIESREKALALLLADTEMMDLSYALIFLLQSISFCGSLPLVRKSLSACYSDIKRAFLEKVKEVRQYEMDGDR